MTVYQGRYKILIRSVGVLTNRAYFFVLSKYDEAIDDYVMIYNSKSKQIAPTREKALSDARQKIFEIELANGDHRVSRIT